MIRTLTILCALALVYTPHLHAQYPVPSATPTIPPTSCMVMSDSMSTALGLTGEQMDLVSAADERCLKACEAVGYRTTRKMDDAAMRTHEREMKGVLTPAQYTRWSAMCRVENMKVGTASPMKH